jgi:hypothetical protein
MSVVRAEVTKPCSRQTSRRTAARVSEKVGRCLRYQALMAVARRAWGVSCFPSRVTSEGRPSRQGASGAQLPCRPGQAGHDRVAPSRNRSVARGRGRPLRSRRVRRWRDRLSGRASSTGRPRLQLRSVAHAWDVPRLEKQQLSQRKCVGSYDPKQRLAICDDWVTGGRRSSNAFLVCSDHTQGHMIQGRLDLHRDYTSLTNVITTPTQLSARRLSGDGQGKDQ